MSHSGGAVGSKPDNVTKTERREAVTLLEAISEGLFEEMSGTNASS